MTAAHQAAILDSTAFDPIKMVPINSIASTGYPLSTYADVDKVKRMQRKLQSGGALPPVKLVKLDPASRDKYGVTDATKQYYLKTGHHRLAAQKLEGRQMIGAVPYDSTGL